MFAMKVSEGGRVVIPAAIRRALELSDGDTVVWDIQNGEIHLSTRKKQLERARALFQKTIPSGSQPQLVEAFLQERRREAEQDGAG